MTKQYPVQPSSHTIDITLLLFSFKEDILTQKLPERVHLNDSRVFEYCIDTFSLGSCYGRVRRHGYGTGCYEAAFYDEVDTCRGWEPIRERWTQARITFVRVGQ